MVLLPHRKRIPTQQSAANGGGLHRLFNRYNCYADNRQRTTLGHSLHMDRSAYLLPSAAATPVWAKLTDIWGRKIILLAAVMTFSVGSAICATSTTMESLITGRSIRGSAAGGMIILTNVCISDLFIMR